MFIFRITFNIQKNNIKHTCQQIEQKHSTQNTADMDELNTHRITVPDYIVLVRITFNNLQKCIWTQEDYLNIQSYEIFWRTCDWSDDCNERTERSIVHL